MRTAHQVTIYVNVNDPAALWEHARSVLLQDNQGARPSFVRELLGTKRRPDLSGCLRMVFDPGQSPPGCEIQDSSCEGGDSLD